MLSTSIFIVSCAKKNSRKDGFPDNELWSTDISTQGSHITFLPYCRGCRHKQLLKHHLKHAPDREPFKHIQQYIQYNRADMIAKEQNKTAMQRKNMVLVNLY